jgi:Flp pilus assembly protein TadG
MMGKSRLVNGTIRQGSALVEFAALMPLFVVIAFLALEGQAMMTRWYFLSHSAYAAARRCATDQRGTSLAQGFVNRDFDRGTRRWRRGWMRVTLKGVLSAQRTATG